MRRFLINTNQLQTNTTTLTGQEANHIQRVLRLKIGDWIELIDGTGTVYQSEISAFSSDTVVLKIQGTSQSKTESPIEIIVAQALLKNRKIDTIIRPLTEIGITQWHPIIADRCIAKPEPDRLRSRLERWRNIAAESLKQCRRSRIPKIGPLLSFEQALEYSQQCDLSIIFWESGSRLINDEFIAQHPNPTKVLLIVGPEGGFTEHEVAKAKQSGVIPLSLGPRILKAETAPLVACTLIQYIFGDMGKKST